jgi:putative aldouronate transport system substrate-binding protein
MEHWAVLPHPPIVEGYGQQKYTFPRVGDPRFMILTDAESPERILELVDWGSSEEGRLYSTLGIEGVNYERDGAGNITVIDALPPARYTYSIGFGDPPNDVIAMQTFGQLKVNFMAATRDNVMNPQNMFMPSSVYEGYTDFIPNSATMYREIAGQIITGQVPATREVWDAYVEEWYDAGGQVVTDRATEWYLGFFGN